MTPRLPAYITKSLQWICAYIGVLYLLVFCFVAFQTLTYPFHIEWMEGQVIDVIKRVRDGLPVYAKPSIDYVAFAYTPYYYYMAALVSLFTGVDFIAGRLLSLGAALVTGILLYRWVRREQGEVPAGLTAVGAYFATYVISGRWMDIARVDSLFLCLTVAGLYVFYFQRDWQGKVIAAALMTAACFTKQTAAIAMAPAFGAMLLLNWRHSIYTALMVFASVVGFSVIGHYMTDGWSTFFIYELESGHGIQWHYIKGFWTHDLLPHLWIWMVLGLATLAFIWVNSWEKGLWYGALVLGFVLCSYAARLNWGGYLNVLMPACFSFALLVGLGMSCLRNIQASFVSWAVLLLVIVQFGHLYYNPYRYIPNQASVDTGNRFLEKLANIEGEVFMPEVQFVQTRVGKKSYTLGMAALDVIVTDLKDKNWIKVDLLREIRDAIEHQEFGAVMPGGVVPVPMVNRYYRHAYGMNYPKEYVTETKNFLRRSMMLPRQKPQVLQ